MNVVKEHGEETESDRIISLLVLAKAFGHILQENEGVVVVPTNDLRDMIPSDIKSLIVFNSKDQVRIIEGGEEYYEQRHGRSHTGVHQRQAEGHCRQQQLTQAQQRQGTVALAQFKQWPQQQERGDQPQQIEPALIAFGPTGRQQPARQGDKGSGHQ